MFTQTAPAPVPESDRMFIPPELRPYYVVDLMGEMKKWSSSDEDKLARELIRRRLAQDPEAWRQTLHTRGRDVSDATYRAWRDEGPAAYWPTDQEIDEELKRVTDADRAWWLHLRRLAAAAEEKVRAEDRAARLESSVASRTCDVCGVTSTAPGLPTWRVGGTWTAGLVRERAPMNDLRACPACADIVNALLLSQAGAERLPDGRTRATAASAWVRARTA